VAPSTRPVLAARAVLVTLATLVLAVPGCAGPAERALEMPPRTERPPPGGEGGRPSGDPGPARPPARPPSIPEAAGPEAVVIPTIGVSARLIRLGLRPDRRMEVPEDFSVAGWYVGGPRPGEPGPAVIAGHVDSRRGPAVFHRLGELRPGDVVTVRYRDRLQVRFRVQRTERHPKAAFPTGRVYGDTAGPALRLVTCGGAFDRASGHYRDNVIVFASAVAG
jgi:hypothetical protein